MRQKNQINICCLNAQSLKKITILNIINIIFSVVLTMVIKKN